MEAIATICVFGDFKSKDIRMKVFPAGSMKQFSFQNILTEAGYDAVLFSLTDEEIEKAVDKERLV